MGRTYYLQLPMVSSCRIMRQTRAEFRISSPEESRGVRIPSLTEGGIGEAASDRSESGLGSRGRRIRGTVKGGTDNGRTGDCREGEASGSKVTRRLAQSVFSRESR